MGGQRRRRREEDSPGYAGVGVSNGGTNNGTTYVPGSKKVRLQDVLGPRRAFCQGLGQTL